MKIVVATVIAALALAFALATSVVAAPHGDQSQCPKQPVAQKSPPRSTTGQANACGPNRSHAGLYYTLAGA